MALHCPNCGEDNLRDLARFCDTCGTSLNPSSSQAETTPARPGTTLIEEEGATKWLPAADTQPDEGATQFIPEAADDGGATRLMPEAEAAGAEGATRAMPEAEFQEDGSTRLMPEMQPDDQGATKAMPADEPLPEDGSTRHMPTQETGGDDSSTIHLAEAETRDQVSTALDEDLTAGHVLQERYRLERMLGRGGFGAVYMAQDLKLKRRCVVKRMRTRGHSPRDIEIFRLNFEREANLLAELNDPGHPNIPEIYDYFSDDSGNYLVMKFIEGRNLQFILDQDEGGIPWREAIRYAVEVCAALDYMHQRGSEPIMHRDVKPANIQLGNDGRVWLVDFGLAKADPVEGSGERSATRASGSLGFTPLEQWLGQAVPVSDIYALGATLHHLVTGVDPLKAYDNTFNIQIIKDLHGQLPPIRKIDRRLSRDLEKIVSRATTAEPGQRPTATQLQKQLEVLVAGPQQAALYTFKNGKSASTEGQLVDLCEQNRAEAVAYLYNGDFERWFLLINRNDLATAATEAVEQGKNHQDGLERFLKLILPNLFVRRLRRAGLHVARGALQFIVIALIVVLLLAVGGSFIVGLLIQQTISSTDWNYEALELGADNVYTENFLTGWFEALAGTYVDDLRVEIRAPDALDMTATWLDVPFELAGSISKGATSPHLHLTHLNDIPLIWVGRNVSMGINNGIDQAFQNGPVDVSRLVVMDGEIILNVTQSDDPNRPKLPTPTPGPTPTPRPTPTPAADTNALVVVFNELDDDVTVEIKEQHWDVGAQGTQVIEIPPGTYDYTVRYTAQPGQIAAQGTRTWAIDKAYSLRIAVEE